MPPSRAKPERILLVESSTAELQRLESALAATKGDCEIVAACGAEAARAALVREGPFAVVVSGYGANGAHDELVTEALTSWPDTVAILLASMADLSQALVPNGNGRVPRLIDRQQAAESLPAAVGSALEEHRARAGARRETGALTFSRDALEDFNSELVERIRIQTHAIHRLHRFVDDLNRSDSFEEIAQLAAAAAHDVTGGRAVHVRLWDHDDTAHLAGAEIASESGAQIGSETLSVDVTTRAGHSGLLLVDSLGPRVTAVEGDLLASIASSTAASVHNLLRRNERDEAQQATILALARLAEQRDNETGKHLERVSQYCRLTAEGLRTDGFYRSTITDEWIRDLERSAPLHDIGKVGIPDAILLKPGKLDANEWSIMQTHAEIGAQCLRDVMEEHRCQGFLQMSLDIAWCHHERWDGTGYPRGLKGADIPLAARILALADVYDALTTVRPYKQAWTHERAIGWLASVAGTHLDPDVVRAFCGRADEADKIRGRLADAVEDQAKLNLRQP